MIIRRIAPAAFVAVLAMGLSAPAFANCHRAVDSAAHSQFGYPGGDSGPHGIGASHDHDAQGCDIQPTRATAAGSQAGAVGGVPTKAERAADSAAHSQFGYPDGDSGPHGIGASHGHDAEGRDIRP